MVKLVEKAKADSIKRVVIDSVNSFAELAESALVLKGHLRNFFRSLNLMGCTTLVILGEDAQDSRSTAGHNQAPGSGTDQAFFYPGER